MPIDMKALERVAAGDPNARVVVNKRWLAEVHSLLTAGIVCAERLEAIDRQNQIFDSIFGDRRPRR